MPHSIYNNIINYIIIYTMPMKTPFELEIVNDNDDNDNGDKVCVNFCRFHRENLP